jgi:hypothetical protein
METEIEKRLYRANMAAFMGLCTRYEIKKVRKDVVVKEGSQWVVKSKAGKVLGKHKTKKAAMAQLRAVEAAKKKRRG